MSNWRLARAVARHGELGVVSGTLLAVILARRPQAGNLEGDLRRTPAHFPLASVAERVLADPFVPGGRAPGGPFSRTPLPSRQPGPALTDPTVAANLIEVFPAEEGHAGAAGINLFEKAQRATPPSLEGAMLADVDDALMGAGIPRSIPGGSIGRRSAKRPS